MESADTIKWLFWLKKKKKTWSPQNHDNSGPYDYIFNIFNDFLSHTTKKNTKIEVYIYW